MGRVSVNPKSHSTIPYRINKPAALLSLPSSIDGGASSLLRRDQNPKKPQKTLKMLSQPSTPFALSKPSISLLSLPSPNLRPSFSFNNRSSHLKNRGFRARSSESKSTVLSNGDSAASTAAVEGGEEGDSEAARLFEVLLLWSSLLTPAALIFVLC